MHCCIGGAISGLRQPSLRRRPSLIGKPQPIVHVKPQASKQRSLPSIAVAQPIAFLGGLFAGFLKLDTNSEPLREWMERTSTRAGVKVVAAKKRYDDVKAKTKDRADLQS